MAESFHEWQRRAALDEEAFKEQERIRGSQIYYMMNPTPWELQRRAFYRFLWAVYLRFVWAMVVLVVGVWMGLIVIVLLTGRF